MHRQGDKVTALHFLGDLCNVGSTSLQGWEWQDP
jgi:hypothetical protein